MKLLQQLHFGASQQLHFGASQFLIFLQLLAQHVCRTCGAGAFGAACSLPVSPTTRTARAAFLRKKKQEVHCLQFSI